MLESQSFSRSYGSILPTSLNYIILETRGFKPWRPDAVICTDLVEAQSPPFGFQGTFKPLRPDQKLIGSYQLFGSHSCVGRVPGPCNCKRKKITFPEGLRVVPKFACVTTERPYQGGGILTAFPFGKLLRLKGVLLSPDLEFFGVNLFLRTG